MRAIIEIDVPDYQLGQEVSIYFKDTMMIKGVVQEPCDDAISRQYLLDNCIVDKVTMPYVPVNKIKEAPSVNPQEPKWNMLLNWLNDMRFGIAPDETVTDIDELHCREAQTDILDEIMDWMKKQTPKGKCLLSQKYRDWLFIQEPKTGHWIAYEVQLPDRTILNYRCSVCGRKLIGYNTKTLSEAPFCHCGAKMIESRESEDKE